MVDSTAASAGKTTIDASVISKVAGIATTSVLGVYSTGRAAERALGAVRDAMDQTDRGQGVSVEVNDHLISIDITIVADYPMPLQKVAHDVRVTVYAAIKEIVGMDVVVVDVTVNDIHIPGDGLDDFEDQVPA